MKHRFLCVDLSTTQIGWAVGHLGEKPIEFGSVARPKGMKRHGEIFLCFTTHLLNTFLYCGCEFIILEELKHMRSASTVRALAGIRGAFMMEAWRRFKVEPLFVDSMNVRQELGVSFKKKGMPWRPDELKIRTMEAVKARGVDVKNFDESDACAILLTGDAFVEIQE